MARQEGNLGLAGHDTSPGRASIRRLTLNDFRCYARQRVETDGRPVVLTGPNGAGKTNLLEAISFLVPGRGLRGARLDEIDRRQDASADCDEAGSRPWAVAAHLDTPDGPVEIGTGREATSAPDGPGRRLVRIDAKPVKNQAALSEYLNVQWLTPRMDRLFTDGASSRRRFIDRMVFGLDPAHAGRVSAYEHALRERSRLIKRRDAAADGDWLAALEDTMAEKGVAVAAARREAAARLHQYCSGPPGPFPGASLEMSGAVDEWLDQGPALAAEDKLREALKASRRTDAEAGGAAAGPHKSDLKVGHLAKGCPAEQCSTGEQKALLIAIVLANVRMQAAERGSLPVLLLDEVAAHLDQARREALFEEITGLGVQAWLSGTDAAVFSPLGDGAQFFSVENAQVRPV
ncbi:MAG: DNA replication/repair protein RecF [Rhodospirillales bacterium]